VTCQAPAPKIPLFRLHVAGDGLHPWFMPKFALILIFAATAIIVVLAATVLGNIVLPAFKLRPDLLTGLIVVAGSGLTAGLALLERSPLKSLQAP
jgi:hypothetical protein